MRFIIKHSQEVKPQKKVAKREEIKKITTDNKKSEVMNDKISMAEEIINDTPKAVKRIKKDKGLIERTESSKTILTEDNKQLLVD